MDLHIDSNAFIGTGSIIDLVSHVGGGKPSGIMAHSARLCVRVFHTISGPETTYAVFFNDKVWHESKDLPGAIEGWNKLMAKHWPK
jgi:hypothetical protein